MKRLLKPSEYSFNATAKTITIIGVTLVEEQLLLITNVTLGIMIYNFAEPLKGGSISGQVLTLDYDTTSMSNTDKLQIWFEAYPQSETGIPETIIVDRVSGEGAGVDSSGRLKVSTQSPEAPIGKTPVVNTYYDVVGGLDTVTNTYIIPNGEALTLQKLYAGSEDGDKVTVIKIYIAPNGTLDGSETILFPLYIQGDNHDIDLAESFLGDGTRAIIVTRTRQDAQAKEVFAKWVGYY